MAIGSIGIRGNLIPPGITGSSGERFVSIRQIIKTTNGLDIRLREDTRSIKGFKELQAIKLRLNDLVERVKESENRNDFIEKIKQNLSTLNKFFPPYPPGMEEHVRLLKAYIAFKTLIERLTIPPESLAMTEDKVVEKSEATKKAISEQDSGITIHSEDMQYLF